MSEILRDTYQTSNQMRIGLGHPGSEALVRRDVRQTQRIREVVKIEESLLLCKTQKTHT